MTNQEAYEKMVRYYGAACVGDEAETVFMMGARALKKQVGIKAVRVKDGKDSYWICPACNTNLETWLYKHGHTYCESCGQRIQWGEEDETGTEMESEN